MKLFKDLTPEEETEFRAWARKNYQPFEPISPVWHPVVLDEIGKINKEADLNLTEWSGTRFDDVPASTRTGYDTD